MIKKIDYLENNWWKALVEMEEKKETQIITHKDLGVWQDGIKLVLEIYRITSCFPKEEKYGLISQMRRASVSFPSNIAEGAARGSKRGFKHFIRIALGTLSELETQIIIAMELGFLVPDSLPEKITILRKRTFCLLRGLGS